MSLKKKKDLSYMETFNLGAELSQICNKTIQFHMDRLAIFVPNEKKHDEAEEEIKAIENQLNIAKEIIKEIRSAK